MAKEAKKVYKGKVVAPFKWGNKTITGTFETTEKATYDYFVKTKRIR